MSEAPTHSVLTPEEAAQFVREGYVMVRQAFPKRAAVQLLDAVWRKVPEEPTDPDTWTRGAAQIEDIVRDAAVAELFTERFRGSLDDILGKGRWWTREDGFGWVVFRFPGFFKQAWTAHDYGWHVDGMEFHHHLTSPEQGLVGIELLTDIEPGGGGTAVRLGSHQEIARRLHQAEPRGLSYSALREVVQSVDTPIKEITGQAGDVLWMHPFMVHARSPNYGARVRVAANRCVGLHEPMNLSAGGEHSLVERAILQALAGESLSSELYQGNTLP